MRAPRLAELRRAGRASLAAQVRELGAARRRRREPAERSRRGARSLAVAADRDGRARRGGDPREREREAERIRAGAGAALDAEAAELLAVLRRQRAALAVLAAETERLEQSAEILRSCSARDSLRCTSSCTASDLAARQRARCFTRYISASARVTSASALVAGFCSTTTPTLAWTASRRSPALTG